MSFSSMSEIEKLDSATLENEIIRVSQELVNLRVKKATRQEFKPHEFKHNKIRLAKSLTIKRKRETKKLSS
jgi:large subunit ribosomal protein L29